MKLAAAKSGFLLSRLRALRVASTRSPASSAARKARRTSPGIDVSAVITIGSLGSETLGRRHHVSGFEENQVQLAYSCLCPRALILDHWCELEEIATSREGRIEEARL